MADSARDAQSVDDRLINLEVNLATLYRLLNLDVVPSAAFSSEADKQALWDLLDELASRVISWDLPQVGKWSFAQTPDFSKLSSWYSWNRAAKGQIPEFWATKMLFDF